MPTIKVLKKIVRKRAKVDWKKVADGERLRKRLLALGDDTGNYQTLSPGYGQRARIIDDPQRDNRLVRIRRSY